MKTFVTISAGVLLALSCVTASDARPHANGKLQLKASSRTTIRITAKPKRGWIVLFSICRPCRYYACSSNGG